MKWTADQRKDCIASLALVVSFLALVVSSGTLCFYIIRDVWPMPVKVVGSAGYAIMRGTSDFPSDHLVLPVDWENTGGRGALVRHPHIFLRAIDPNSGGETGIEYAFFLAGEYPEISGPALTEPYVIRHSFSLPPHSVSTRVLVFRVRNWHDEQDPLYQFRLKGGEKFNVYIDFERNLTLVPKSPLCQIEIFKTVDGLGSDRDTDRWWDYFELEK